MSLPGQSRGVVAFQLISILQRTEHARFASGDLYETEKAVRSCVYSFGSGFGEQCGATLGCKVKLHN